MGAADQRTENTLKIAMSVIVVLMLAMTVFGLFSTNLHIWFSKAPVALRILGVLVYLATFLPIIFSDWITDKTQSETAWAKFWVLVFVIAIFTSAGFDFSL